MIQNGLSSGKWERHQTLALDEEKYVSARACSISEENESAYINAVNELGYCDHYSKTETGVFIRTPTPYSKTGVFMRTPTPLAERYMLLYVQLWGVPMLLALMDTGSEVNLISAEVMTNNPGWTKHRRT